MTPPNADPLALDTRSDRPAFRSAAHRAAASTNGQGYPNLSSPKYVFRLRDPRSSLCRIPLPALTALLLFLIPGPLTAQTNQPPVSANRKPRTETQQSAPPPTPSALPARSPVAAFRELLAMRPEERAKFLAQRSPENRKLIKKKLAIYLELSPDERELRLRATELCWYLLPLLQLPPANRAARLSVVPAEYRSLIDDRLREWDQLSPSFQFRFLQNQVAMRYFADLRENLTNSIARARQAGLHEAVERFQAMPESERQELLDRFGQFFDLRPREKSEALRTLSEAERRQISNTLQSFEKLTPAQRLQCLRSFEKFASLSPVERRKFLKNADRWALMTPKEREDWRELVRQAPVLPVDGSPAQAAPLPPTPPLPHPARPAQGPTSLVTNR